MQIVLVTKVGKRSLMEVAKPELVIRLQSAKAFTDYEVHSIDFSQRFVYVEKAA